MKSRIYLLLIFVLTLGNSLVCQTPPPASMPASGASTSGTPVPALPTSGTHTSTVPPAGQTPAQSDNAAKSDSDDSVATIVHTVNEVRVVFTVTDRHGRYIKDLKAG